MCRIRVSVLLPAVASVVLTCSAALAQAPLPISPSQQILQQGSSPQPVPSTDNPQQPQPERKQQSMSEANSRIQRSAEDLLRGDPQLSGADLQVSVDDHAITLTGTVDSYTQHQRVLALMQQYARYRGIVDKLLMK